MRISIALLIIILLPFLLGFSYGSTVTELNLNTRIMMMKERMLTPDKIITDDQGNIETFELPETPKSPPSIPSNVHLNKLMLKERIMTPEIIFKDDEAVIENLEVPETPLSPVFHPIEYHFTEYMMF